LGHLQNANMITAKMITATLAKMIMPVWLTGPIFDKELRVSSRRRRSYVMRFVYIALLGFFVVLIWGTMLARSGLAVYEVSRMSEAGKAIVTTVVWFQFLATQLIAVVILSTAISDEIYDRTLGVLMTTPINSFQIVMGKLFSKLLQLILLMAISLPLLGIIRVLGGVPWDYVVTSLCITLTAVIFAGSLSLYFSIKCQRAYAVILKTLFCLGFLYLFIPMIIGLIFFRYSQTPLLSWLSLVNPFLAMQMNSMSLVTGVPKGAFFFIWPVHCGMMFAASGLLLGRSVKIVRKVALLQATGQIEAAYGKSRKKMKTQAARVATSEVRSAVIRPVTGSPVVWKELMTPMIQGGRKAKIAAIVITVISLLITYAVNMREKILQQDFVHVSYCLIFVIIGIITNLVLSATTITTEKETRSWPILLATSMEDWQILAGKAVGVVRKCLPIWLLLAAHLLIFISIGYIHPIAAVHMGMIVAGTVMFISGSGLYFSARMKRTTSAVVANFAFLLTLWAIIPMVLEFLTVAGLNRDFLQIYVSANPVVQTAVTISGASGSNAGNLLSSLGYDWPDRSAFKDVWSTTLFLLAAMLTYMAVGMLFAWRAKCRFRRDIF
jgi:ABC-type transport system involved in multi-copper enzyme maturation permease subunit